MRGTPGERTRALAFCLYMKLLPEPELRDTAYSLHYIHLLLSASVFCVYAELSHCEWRSPPSHYAMTLINRITFFDNRAQWAIVAYQEPVSPIVQRHHVNTHSQNFLLALQKNHQLVVGETYVASTSNSFLGRNYKLRNLEQTFAEKDREIQFLQYQVEKAWYRADKSTKQVQSAEAIYQRYQDQYDIERMGRTKSQLAAAEAFQSLQTCVEKRDQLLSTVSNCNEDQNVNDHQVKKDKRLR